MTLERAMEILDPNHREHYENIEVVEEACRIGMKAIEKQIPKKPINVGGGKYVVVCPNCKNTILYSQYCHDCGQTLDFEEKQNE